MELVKDKQAFRKHVAKDLTIIKNQGYTSFYDIEVDFNLRITLENEVTQGTGLAINDLHFENCVFKKGVSFLNCNIVIWFENCHFHESLNAENRTFSKKVRFRNCKFYCETNFRNTTFKDLADFWRCTFEKKLIFFKTDFLGTTVFSATTFKENVLFTYSHIDKLILFRGTEIEKGFDISTAIRSGDMGIFDFHVRDYNSLNENLSEEAYENAISKEANIPIKNKRETFRILKQEHISQNNVVQSIEYKKLEKETLRGELLLKLEEKQKSQLENVLHYLEIRLDQLNLWLNKVSNNHGSSYGRAFLFVVLIGWLFFYSSLLATTKYSFSLNPLKWEFSAGMKFFVQYLLPTHRFDYMGVDSGLTSWFYVFDFVGRLIVGYGIYQFVQAFRKYR